MLSEVFSCVFIYACIRVTRFSAGYLAYGVVLGPYRNRQDINDIVAVPAGPTSPLGSWKEEKKRMAGFAAGYRIKSCLPYPSLLVLVFGDVKDVWCRVWCFSQLYNWSLYCLGHCQDFIHGEHFVVFSFLFFSIVHVEPTSVSILSTSTSIDFRLLRGLLQVMSCAAEQ